MRSDASNKLLSSRLLAALAVFKKSPLFKLRGAKTRSRVVETGKQPHSPKLLGSWPTECDRSEFARLRQQQWVGYPRTSRCEVRPRPTIASGIDDRPISGEKDFDFFSAFTVQLQLFTFYSFNGRGARRAIKSRLCTSPLNFCRMKSTRRLLCHATRQRQQQSAIPRRL